MSTYTIEKKVFLNYHPQWAMRLLFDLPSSELTSATKEGVKTLFQKIRSAIDRNGILKTRRRYELREEDNSLSIVNKRGCLIMKFTVKES